MIVFLLLVIVAILLFGAAAVRGFIGSTVAVFGLLAAAAVLLILAQHVPTWLWIVLGVIVAGFVGWAINDETNRKAEIDRMLAENRRLQAEATKAEQGFKALQQAQAEATARLARHQPVKQKPRR